MSTSAASSAQLPAAVRDFDFLVGTWNVHHHKLQHRLAGNDNWWDFDGTSTLWKILGGLGNADDNVLHQPTGTYRGASVRLFDLETQLWSIWWMSEGHAVIEPPVVGRFDNGRGVFSGRDSLTSDDGEVRAIDVRFVWSDITDNSARWEQAFSPDGGVTWETNWIMQFQRAS